MPATPLLRPRRSVLYMPGSNSRALDKARSLDADALILDLEDAVAPDQKPLARQQVCAAVNAGGFGHRELVIRCNSLSSSWGEDDLAAAAATAADAICLPKVESAAEICRAVALLDQHGASPAMAIWAMIETPRGVLNIQAIAAAHPRLQVLVLGTSDLSKELRVPHTPDRLGFITSLGLCVLAARAFNLDVIDGVHLDLQDTDGYLRACEQGRALGFDGKSLIHPQQIDAANRVFGPAADAAGQAQAIIAAWEAAVASGQGVVVVNGKLVENLHVDEARRTLAIVAAIAARNA